jgi:hypothetical protein
MRKILLSLVACTALVAGACDDESDNGGTGGTGGSTGGRGGSGGSGGSSGAGGTTSTGGSGGSTGGTGGSTGGSSGTGGSTGGTSGTGGSTGGTGGSTGGTGGTGGSATDAKVETGSDTSAANPEPGGHPQCPRCVKVFNGMNFDGWEASPSTWKIVDGAMRGQGGTSRAAYTKKDYGNFRLILTSRMAPINGDHLGILFWGDRPTDPNRPKIDLAAWLQWMPPNGSMWSYHAPMHHSVRAMSVNPGPGKIDQWHTSELLFNLDKGTLRTATDGVEINRYTHPWPTERMDQTKKIIKGPLAMMRHGGGASEYKDIWIEEEPVGDELVTLKK